jgi:hypothetical protein
VTFHVPTPSRVKPKGLVAATVALKIMGIPIILIELPPPVEQLTLKLAAPVVSATAILQSEEIEVLSLVVPGEADKAAPLFLQKKATISVVVEESVKERLETPAPAVPRTVPKPEAFV